MGRKRIVPEVGGEEFEQIGQNVLRELSRRLSIPAAAESLPGTLLMKLAENYLRYLEKKTIEGGGEPLTLAALEIIDTDGITLERKVEIMQQYLDDLEAEWRAASERMAELHEELVRQVDEEEAVDGDAD